MVVRALGTISKRGEKNLIDALGHRSWRKPLKQTHRAGVEGL
jgi:hypothetical protein